MGVDCLAVITNSRTATMAAANREGLKSFMAMGLVASMRMTMPLMVWTSPVYLGRYSSWMLRSYISLEIMRSIS